MASECGEGITEEEGMLHAMSESVALEAHPDEMEYP
jgi:hypothetical protein